MSTAILVMPKYHLLKVTLTTPAAAALVAEAMKEVTELKHSWYGFSLTPGTKPNINGCCVLAGVQNANAHVEGLDCCRKSMGMRSFQVFEPEQITKKAGPRAPVIKLPRAS